MIGEITISLIGMLISAGAFVNAFSFPHGTSDGVPGAGVFPQALCVVIFMLNLIVIINAVKNRKGTGTIKMTEEQKDKMMKIGMIVVAAALFLILWGKVHFVILCSLFLIAFGVILKQNMKFYIPGAIVSSAVVYVVFQQLLNVMLNS